MRAHAYATAVVLAVVLAAALLGGVAHAQAPTLTFTGYVPRTGVSVVVMDQSANPTDVAPALARSGCVAQSLAITERGAFVVYIIGAPEFANAAFPALLSAGTPLAIRCTPTSTTVSATTVTHYVPAKPAAATAQEGSCFGTSAALPARADAWRCTVGNAIQDPCFALADGTVVCGANPVTDEAGFILALTEPLPAPEISPNAPDDASRNGWLVQLEDGTICEINTGATTGINGVRANYGCADQTWILGDLMPGTVWTAELASITVGEAGPRLGAAREAVIRQVWQ